MSFMPVNPRPMLQELVGKPVAVRLKWGETEYKGALVSIDSYMNLQLSDTEEYIDGESTGQLGQVLIRCVAPLPLCFLPSTDANIAGATTCCGFAVTTRTQKWRTRRDVERKTDRQCTGESSQTRPGHERDQ